MALVIDTSHSEVGFSVRHMVIAKVRGYFTKWSATIEAPNDDLEKAKLTVSIDAASIDTREAKRDAHLRSADFFDADQHPKLEFVSTKIERSGDRYSVTGDLTIRGVTKPVVLAVESLGSGKDPWGNTRLGFSARATIARKEWGLNWNQALELGGVLVGEDVTLEIEAQVIKQG
jgi:polyisoprenoid-binding protein YceI